MANKHMEPTDESDGFVNITPDPNRPVQVRNSLYVVISMALLIRPHILC
jgi:hypothetical protein